MILLLYEYFYDILWKLISLEKGIIFIIKFDVCIK